VERTIDLPEDQLRELERLASTEHRSVDEVVQFAVGDYLARRQGRSDWAKRLEAAVDGIRKVIPPGVTPDEIEADVTAAWEEYRAERAAQRISASPPDAGGC
jgi:Arc/MetJ-type ribon-helix-helix transcriptional regulator